MDNVSVYKLERKLGYWERYYFGRVDRVVGDFYDIGGFEIGEGYRIE